MEKRLEVPRGACDEYVLPSDIARGRWADGLPMQDLGDDSSDEEDVSDDSSDEVDNAGASDDEL